MPSMLCAPLGTRLSSGFPQSSSTERALVLGTISVADNPLGVASLRPVEVLRYRGFRRRVREGGGRTADPSTSLRFGRDDKGESSVSIKHRIVAEHTAGPSTTLGSGAQRSGEIFVWMVFSGDGYRVLESPPGTIARRRPGVRR